MPKEAVDYSRTVMYKIVCNDLSVTDLYVGHTTDFRRRKYQHKSACKTNNNLKIYQIIRENGSWNNWSMIQVEEYCCSNGNEATARERYWYETLNANMNKSIPSRSKKEYYENNKEQIAENKKEYREKNKEQLAKIKKDYYEMNKEKIIIKSKEYYYTNKENIMLKRNEKFDCECGGKYTYANKSRHFKTNNKHKKYIQSLVNQNNII